MCASTLRDLCARPKHVLPRQLEAPAERGRSKSHGRAVPGDGAMADVAKRRKREAFLKFPGDYVFALADHRLLAIEDDPGAGRSIASDLKHVSVKGDVLNITGYDEEEFLKEPNSSW